MQLARVGDAIQGTTSSTHQYHYEQDCYYNEFGDYVCDEPYKVYDPPCTINGIIVTGSTNVYANGQSVSFVGSTTSETDCFDTGEGVVASGSSSVYVNGKQVARNGDIITPHDGTATIISGSPNVFAN